MLILASLSGIQDFLFDVRESGGKQARSLRNRSFRVQLMAECVALRLLEAAGLPSDRILFSAAGKVCIDAGELPQDRQAALRGAAADIERRLLGQTHGRLKLSIALDSSAGGFAEQFERANRALAADKLKPYSPRSGGWGDDALCVRQLWDADAEADRDARLGSNLVSARWLTIRRSNSPPDTVEADTLGYRVSLDANEPAAAADIVSCSNLAEPHSAPRLIDRRLFRPRRLARHVPRDPRNQPIEFLNLAVQSRGAPMLGVLKADADSLGAAISETLRRSTAGGAAALQRLSDALDRFFAETLDAEMRREPWNLIYTVFSGGDDILVVGPWNVMLDFAGHTRRLFDASFGNAARDRPCSTPLTLSGGVAIIKPRYPVHLAARQADDLLEQAKGTPAPRASTPKDQCAALGSVWKWQHHDAIIGAGRQLADWVDDGTLRRGWLHTLLELALLCRGQAGPEYAGSHPAVATSRLAYHVARNWPPKRSNPRNDAERAGNAARDWIDAILREFDQFDNTSHIQTIHLPAIVRYAMLATSAGGSEDES